MLIPEEIRKYILRRVDDKEIIDNCLPKNRRIRVIVKCSDCGKERETNIYGC